VSQHDESSPDRREFLLRLLRAGGAGGAALGAGAWLAGRSHRPGQAPPLVVDRRAAIAPDPALPVMAIVQGESPARLVAAALDALGGIRRFVSRGDVVAVKPNIGWDRAPEQAANTNPEVVAAVVRACLEAGARRVVVADSSCNDARTSYDRSGIASAAGRAGAEIVLPEPRRFKEVNLQGDSLTTWPVFEPFLAADKVINLPIAKHHSLTGVTIGMKNWYGLLGGQRSRLHQRIHESLVDLAAFARPTLTIVDAYRVLLRNGPTGGSLDDVEYKKTVVAGTDPVALDAFVAKAWWDLDAERLPYLRLAEERGLGRMRFEDLRTVNLTV
jgi:uncharacterized protein (DUF362 family)